MAGTAVAVAEAEERPGRRRRRMAEEAERRRQAEPEARCKARCTGRRQPEGRRTEAGSGKCRPPAGLQTARRHLQA